MDKDTIKVVYIQEPPIVTLTLTDVDSSFSSNINGSFQSTDGSVQPSDDACSSVSSHDTLPISPGLMRKSLAQQTKGWPSEFAIPHFSSDA